MSSKSKKRSPQVSMNMENMSKEILSVMDGVRSGRLKVGEIEEALAEERGWRIE